MGSLLAGKSYTYNLPVLPFFSYLSGKKEEVFFCKNQYIIHKYHSAVSGCLFVVSLNNSILLFLLFITYGSLCHFKFGQKERKIHRYFYMFYQPGHILFEQLFETQLLHFRIKSNSDKGNLFPHDNFNFRHFDHLFLFACFFSDEKEKGVGIFSQYGQPN